jgi:pimeloyl-ACP methyl ester carboxylesterase
MALRPLQVILIHGAGGGGWEWDHWRPVLEGRGFRALAPDLMPGPQGIAATQLRDYARQVVALAEQSSRSGPVVLAGASMGGLLALMVASQMAARQIAAEALILVNSVPPARTAGWPPSPAGFPSVLAWSTQSTLEGTRASMPDADEDTVRWAHARWRDESGAVMRELYRGVEVLPPDTPTLVVIGQEDTEVPPGIGIEAARQLAADVMIFSGVSHVGALLGARAPLIARLACDWLQARMGL